MDTTPTRRRFVGLLWGMIAMAQTVTRTAAAWGSMPLWAKERHIEEADPGDTLARLDGVRADMPCATIQAHESYVLMTHPSGTVDCALSGLHHVELMGTGTAQAVRPCTSGFVLSSAGRAEQVVFFDGATIVKDGGRLGVIGDEIALRVQYSTLAQRRIGVYLPTAQLHSLGGIVQFGNGCTLEPEGEGMVMKKADGSVLQRWS